MDKTDINRQTNVSALLLIHSVGEVKRASVNFIPRLPILVFRRTTEVLSVIATTAWRTKTSFLVKKREKHISRCSAVVLKENVS